MSEKERFEAVKAKIQALLETFKQVRAAKLQEFQAMPQPVAARTPVRFDPITRETPQRRAFYDIYRGQYTHAKKRPMLYDRAYFEGILQRLRIARDAHEAILPSLRDAAKGQPKDSPQARQLETALYERNRIQRELEEVQEYTRAFQGYEPKLGANVLQGLTNAYGHHFCDIAWEYMTLCNNTTVPAADNLI